MKRNGRQVFDYCFKKVDYCFRTKKVPAIGPAIIKPFALPIRFHQYYRLKQDE